MVKMIVAAALFAASTQAVMLNKTVYNQYAEEEEVTPKEDRLAEYEADEEQEDQRSFGGDDEELSQLSNQ
jgi:hypothetical protein